MHKVSLPISIATVTEENLPVYLASFRKCRAERIFICGVDNVYTAESLIKTNPAWVGRVIRYFQEHGLEVGIWISAFGHGVPLFADQDTIGDYTPIEGIDGRHAPHALCPLDPKFRADYADAIRKIAALGPDLIMLDDDFRMNTRVRYYRFGCFCPRHRKEYYARIGEEISHDRLEELIFCGGENKYRTAYMDLMADTLLGFAKLLRGALDEVNPSIRLGSCLTFESWDLCGTDAVTLARAFAGNTKPFMRIACAPYWNVDIIPVIEYARTQLFWGKDSGVEIFCEGDTYPRPRYNVPSKTLELFDLALLADGTADGILNYLYDYLTPPDYETGYVDRYVHNEALREQVKELFANKKPIGVRVLTHNHKFKQWELPKTLPAGLFASLHRAGFSPAQALLSRNAIPTSFDEASDYPALLFGENARHIDPSDLKNGAILDVVAARILQARGIDVGLLSEQKAAVNAEHFIDDDRTMPSAFSQTGFPNMSLYRIECAPNAKVSSTFLPSNTPATYCYENADGVRFFVLALDFYASREQTDMPHITYVNECKNYWNNYHRQAQMIRVIEWLGGKALPATCQKNPNLYMLASRGEKSMSVALCNVYLDDVLTPTVKLDRAYSSIRFVGCTGTLSGDTVTLSDIPPYGFAAFEVT